MVQMAYIAPTELKSARIALTILLFHAAKRLLRISQTGAARPTKLARYAVVMATALVNQGTSAFVSLVGVGAVALRTALKPAIAKLGIHIIHGSATTRILWHLASPCKICASGCVGLAVNQGPYTASL